jgi:hypothetical protein
VPTAHGADIFGVFRTPFPRIGVIAGFLICVVQQQAHIGPLRDLGCSCDVIGDPLTAARETA